MGGYKKTAILVCALLTAWNMAACGQVKEEETVSAEESAVKEQENREQTVERIHPETTRPVDESYYRIATDISRTEVEAYAANVKQAFMERDWPAVSSEISYPITISGVTYPDSKAFLDASNQFDGNLNEEFFSRLEKEDCTEMFVNWQGIMLGETGQIWIAEVLDDTLNSRGLKIIAMNGLLKE